MDRAIVFGTISWGFESLRTRILRDAESTLWVCDSNERVGTAEMCLRSGQRTSAPLAQLAEHLTLNQAVEGSIPSRRIVNGIHCGSRTTQYESRVWTLGRMWGVLSLEFGRVLELVDRIDLGSIGVTPREGSSPSSPMLVLDVKYPGFECLSVRT